MIALVPFSAAAQSVPQGTSVSITSQPKYPEPFTPMQLTLEAYGLAILDEQITWYVNGALFQSGTRTITLTGGGVGAPTHVAVLITSGGAPRTVEKTITPGTLSVLLESSVPTSPFVREKMGIPAGTPFTAIALYSNGNPSTKYTYRWELGQKNGGIQSGQRFPLTMPLFETDLIVTVTDTEGTVVHQGGVTLTPATPLLSVHGFANGVVSPFPLEGSYRPLADTESFLAVIRSGAANAPRWFMNDTEITAPNVLTLSQLLSANAELRVELPYGPFNTLTAAKTIMLTQ